MPMQIMVLHKPHIQNGKERMPGEIIRVPFELGQAMIRNSPPLARETSLEEKVASANAKRERAEEILRQAEAAEQEAGL